MSLHALAAAGGTAPGSTQLQQLVGYATTYGIAACVIGLIVAAASWTFAHRAGNPSVEASSKKGAVMALAGAVIIGAAAGLIAFAQALGGQVH